MHDQEVLLEKSNTGEGHDERQGGDHQVQEPFLQDAIHKKVAGWKEKGKVIGDGKGERLTKEDPILDLFKPGWHMNKLVKQAKGTPMARPALCTN